MRERSLNQVRGWLLFMTSFSHGYITTPGTVITLVYFLLVFKPKKLPIQRMHRTTKQSTSQAKQVSIIVY